MKIDYNKENKRLILDFDDQHDVESFLRNVSYAERALSIIPGSNVIKGIDSTYLRNITSEICACNPTAYEMLNAFYGHTE